MAEPSSGRRPTGRSTPGVSSAGDVRRSDSEQILEQYGGAVDDLFVGEICTSQILKSDHENRPLWVYDKGKILLESFSPIAGEAQDFLVAISEPVSRPAYIHEYQLSEYSLYAAVSMGLKSAEIIEMLDRLSKVAIPEPVKAFIEENTKSYGKVHLILKEGRYWIESTDSESLQRLQDDEIIGPCILKKHSGRTPIDQPEPSADDLTNSPSQQYSEELQLLKEPDSESMTGSADHMDLFDLFENDPSVFDDFDDEWKATDAVNANVPLKKAVPPKPAEDIRRFDNIYDIAPTASNRPSLEISQQLVEVVRKRASELSLPMLEEYDFRNDGSNAELTVDLKPTTRLRSYQEQSLSKMFGSGRARSGIIVLPCGAGKTLVGVTAACTIKRNCLVLCTSGVSVAQWSREFANWSTIQEGQIGRFTAQTKEKFVGDVGVMISTYTMITYSGKRAYDAQQMMDFILAREWGFLLLDEVHVVPAEMFRKVLTIVAAHAKLGLTATLVREDDKITNLNYLIGPKLYEANWMELAQKGHIADVQCAEVWCHMTAEFYREYLRESARKQQLLYTVNPGKFQACQYLIDFHESRGDKIIVFSDNIFALKNYATKLNKPYLFGGSHPAERLRVLHQFQHNPAINCIFISKIGDTSIDLPEANCLIQISSHYGSRRQEAQRLGRILRAKPSAQGLSKAYFYTLISRDTQEVYYSSKRQQFLINQGYHFKVIANLEGLKNLPGLVYSTRAEQLELLSSVLISAAYDENDVEEPEIIDGTDLQVRDTSVYRTGTLQSLSGADSMAYIEYNKYQGRKLRHKRHKPNP
ncbi:P-loop containing nucleoside triphosphate hydrolase protein [Phlyctochytrium arcticum]|nr:P-loop containing nucleoside triphosphate hydrolase protein [Phlyctochytrium arcticum]